MTTASASGGRATEIAELKRRIAEQEELLNAIHRGEIDALVVKGERGDQVYTLTSADEAFRLLVESTGEGAMLADADGAIVYANAAMTRLLRAPLETIVGSHLSRWLPSEATASALRKMRDAPPGETLLVEAPLRSGEGPAQHPTSARLTISRADPRGPAALSVIATDLTSTKEQQAVLERRIAERTAALEEASAQMRQRIAAETELRATNRRFAFLSAINEALLRTSDPESLLAEACRIATTVGGYRLAWVGLAVAEGKAVKPIAQAGFERGYLERARLTWDDTERGRGPTGRAIRQREPQVSRDILRDPTMAPWRADANKRGYASSCAMPFTVGDDVFVFHAYSGQPDAFDQDELAIFKELAGDLSVGIEAMRTREAKARADAEYQRIFDQVADVLFTIAVEPDGAFRFVTVNPAFEVATGVKLDAVVGKRVDEVIPRPSLDVVLANYREVVASGLPRSWRETTEYPTGRKIGDVTMQPVLDARGACTHLVGVVHDVTESVAAQEAERRRTRLLGTLAAIDEAMLKVREETAILREACRLLVEKGGYRMAWVGLVRGDGDARIEPAAWAGHEEGYLAIVRELWARTSEAHRSSLASLRAAKPVVIPDVAGMPDAPWKAAALERGYASAISLPLSRWGYEPIGSLNVYAEAPQAFNKDELELLVQLANDVAYGVDRTRAREALRASEERYRVVTDSMLDLIMATDDEGRITFVSPSCRDLLAYEPEELLGTPSADLEHPVDHAARATRRSEALEKNGRSTDVLRVRRKDGAWIWVEATSRAMVKDGKRVGVVSSSRDITKRVQAEDALRASEERYRLVTDSMLDMVTVTDENARYTFVSPSSRALLGYEPAELLGRPTSDVIDPEDLAEYRKTRATVLGQPAGPGGFVLRVRRKDGSRIWIEAASRVITKDGKFVGLVSSSRDVTKRKEAEDEVHRLNADLERRVAERTRDVEAAMKELESFSYSVSHDLRAPLRAIDGFSKALLVDYKDKLDAQAQDELQRVRAATQRMAALIEDILRLSRVSRAELHKENVDITAIAREILAELHMREPARVVETHVQDGMIAFGDPPLVRAVVQNFLDNAWKFTSKHATATIEVGSTQTPDGVAFFVRDDGAGFDPKYADKLYGAFQRLHSPDEFPGNGIGLATVRRIVTRHHGKTWADGQVEKGATFYFQLPREGDAAT